MNILYGVSGEGWGHVSHAIYLSRKLISAGHKVTILTYGSAYQILKKEFDVIEVSGLNVVYKNGSMKYFKTLFLNIPRVFKNISNIPKLHKYMINNKPDWCLSDMEPTVSFLSYFYRVPLISLSNQNRFVRFKLDFPIKYIKDYLIAKMAILLITPFAKKYIALSFSKLKGNYKNTYLAAPIIRDEVFKLKSREKDFILVYLSKENDLILDMLKKINQNFIVFGYNLNKRESNLQFKNDVLSFPNYFADCKAIISASGFTSVGEAIYLKKPYLAVPLKGQFEQLFNSLFIRKHKIGNYYENLTFEKIKYFITKIPEYKSNMKKYKINLKSSSEILLNIIDEK